MQRLMSTGCAPRAFLCLALVVIGASSSCGSGDASRGAVQPSPDGSTATSPDTGAGNSGSSGADGSSGSPGSSGSSTSSGSSGGSSGSASSSGSFVDAGDATAPPPASPRVDVSIDDAWRFIKMDATGAQMPSFDDSAWDAVTLPHTWNVADGESPNYYRGPGWYRRHVTVPATYAGRRLYLQFDAANKVADVYVDGNSVGQHRGGQTIFRFDVSQYLTVGPDHVIAVRVDNTNVPDVPPLPGGDFTQFGGLYRDAHLLVTDAVHVDVLDYASPGVFITPKNVSAASSDLDVRVELVNDDASPHTVDVEVDVVDAAGQS